MPQKLIYQGAEAKILLNSKNNTIVKDRIKKSYRIPEMDEKIRKQRTKREEKLLTKASKIINAPLPLSINNNKLKIQFIEGKKLSEHLDKFPIKKQKQILKQIGKDIAKLHNTDIIHGDLTTSNMILVEKNGKGVVNSKKTTDDKTKTKKIHTLIVNNQISASDSERIFFIDFGLGFISHKFEDKAVDLHLLNQALEAKHYKNYKTLINEVIKGYKTGKDPDKVLEQLKKVEKRGRYKK